MFLRVSEQLGLNVLTHPKLLKTTFFGISFEEDGGKLKTQCVEVVIPATVLKARSYCLQNVNFDGLLPELIHRTTLMSSSSPKKQQDLGVFKDKDIGVYEGKLYDFLFLGIKLNFIPSAIMSVIEMIGRYRILMGKNYDIWK